MTDLLKQARELRAELDGVGPTGLVFFQSFPNPGKLELKPLEQVGNIQRLLDGVIEHFEQQEAMQGIRDAVEKRYGPDWREMPLPGTMVPDTQRTHTLAIMAATIWCEAEPTDGNLSEEDAEAYEIATMQASAAIAEKLLTEVEARQK